MKPRKTFSQSRSRTIGATSAEIAGPADHRIAIIICPDDTNDAFLAFDGAAAANAGIKLNAGGDNIYLDLETYGDIIKGPINAICAAGDTAFAVCEFYTV